MLNKFTSNTKRLNKVITGINFNNLLDLASVTASLEGVIQPEKPIQSLTKINSNPTKVRTTKNIISTFHSNLGNFAARNIYKTVTTIQKTSIGRGESYLNKLIINNARLDYGIEEPGPENFEIFIDGLHIPGIFSVKQVGTNLEITINEQWIIDDRVTGPDILVFGKIKDV